MERYGYLHERIGEDRKEAKKDGRFVMENKYSGARV